MKYPKWLVTSAVVIAGTTALAGGLSLSSENSTDTLEPAAFTQTITPEQQARYEQRYAERRAAAVEAERIAVEEAEKEKEAQKSLEVERKTTSPNLSNDSYYTNVDGNEVHSPAYSDRSCASSGASATCGDGTCSFSQNRRGTCSHHGGVSQWH